MDAWGGGSTPGSRGRVEGQGRGAGSRGRVEAGSRGRPVERVADNSLRELPADELVELDLTAAVCVHLLAGAGSRSAQRSDRRPAAAEKPKGGIRRWNTSARQAASVCFVRLSRSSSACSPSNSCSEIEPPPANQQPGGGSVRLLEWLRRRSGAGPLAQSRTRYRPRRTAGKSRQRHGSRTRRGDVKCAANCTLEWLQLHVVAMPTQAPTWACSSLVSCSCSNRRSSAHHVLNSLYSTCSRGRFRHSAGTLSA